VPGQKFVDPVDLVVGDTSEHIGEPGLWIHVIELGGLDQGVGDGPLCQGSCRMDFKVNENQKWAMNRKEHDVSDRTEGSGHREDASAA